MLALGPQYGFGLYVHWPYCSKICPYCDFNVFAAKDRDPEPLIAAICNDIRAYREFMQDHPALDTVFFGGGTPSLLAPAHLQRIMTVADKAFGVKADAEITLEANPNDILSADLGGWKTAGISRLSIGVQSLRDDALRFLGRDHDSHKALEAVSKAASLFDNHSIDLIYARPGQSLAEWRAELSEALALGTPHFSLYELTIEQRTAFGQRAARGDLVPMEDDDQADLYELTQARCDAACLPAYEVSNHASAPQYQSRHNMIYWNSGDWIGVGPGAHGRITVSGERFSTEASRKVADYVESAQPKPVLSTSLDVAREFVAMGLRPTMGLDLSRFETLVGHPPRAGVLADLQQQRLIAVSADRLALTAPGRLLADRITALLAP